MFASRILLIFISILTLSTLKLNAQSIADLIESPKEKGDKFYNEFSYVKAIDAYKNALDNSNNDQDKLILQIAESYRKLNDPANALIWYDKIIEENWNDSSIYLLHYAQALSAEKQYAEAKDWYKLYNDAASDDNKIANEQINAIINQKKFYDKTSAVTISKTNFNIDGMDFSPAFFGDDLIFVSSRKKDSPIKADYNWDQSDYLDLFLYHPETQEVERFFKRINSRYHEGSVVVYDNGNKMLLTRNAFHNGKLTKSSQGVTKLQIFSTEKDEKGEWGNPQPINLNNPEYSIGHPALTKDAQTLFFVSDMPDGFGGTDIYMSKKEGDVWQEPINLGPEINTSANEMFPFLFDDKQLFFASNGHGGLGGLDIFGIDISNGLNGRVVNLGAPLNSSYDDFGLIVDQTARAGFFSSNRDGSKNNDDIYSFSSTKDLISSYLLKGVVYDKIENSPLKNTTLKLLDGDDNIVDTTTSNSEGAYQFQVKPDKSYTISAEKDEYLPTNSEFNTYENNDSDVWEKDFQLLKAYTFGLKGTITETGSDTPIDSVSVKVIDNFSGDVIIEKLTDDSGTFITNLEDKKLNDRVSYQLKLDKQGYLSKTVTYNGELSKPGYLNLTEDLDFSLDKIEVGADIGKLIDIQPIYFDLGKSVIRPDAAKELDKIVQVMNENPEMVIELGSHTDSRGGDAFNLKLSDKRAKASASYIVSQGIEEDRITGKGYGETQLINRCTNNVKCSESEHQLNRRTEFTIVKF